MTRCRLELQVLILSARGESITGDGSTGCSELTLDKIILIITELLNFSTIPAT